MAAVARANEHLPLAVSVVAVVLIGYYLARVFWLLYPAAPAAPWQPPQPSQQMAQVAAGPADTSAITATHLFGEASTEAPELTGDAALNAPDTSLSLQLRGAIAADNPKTAHAIIADASGNEHVYFTNASLPGGATLQQIQADRVILSRAGQLEVLRLPREGQGGGSTGRASPPSFQSPASQSRDQCAGTGRSECCRVSGCCPTPAIHAKRTVKGLPYLPGPQSPAVYRPGLARRRPRHRNQRCCIE